MEKEKRRSKDLIELKNFLNYNEKIATKDVTFEKLMFIYKMAIKELNTKLEIIREEYKTLYEYNLIDHINYRIKKPESIIKKMEKKECKCTYREMIENINDIAGLRIICPLRNDIYAIRNLIQKLQGVEILKEKDYIMNPKESGYSAYHMILGVPVTLSKGTIYVKVEVQIRTMVMDFWATMEHKMKYKSKQTIDKKKSKEWITSAKIAKKLDYKMMSLS